MILFPNAKINLGLFVTEKRPDNYHNIETLFYPVPNYCDILEVIDSKSGKDEFSTSGLPIEGEFKNNLVYVALQKMRELITIPPVKIHLHKIIPSGSGLGGGSSDAAFMLKLLNEQYNGQLSIQQLEKIGAKIGADVPVFIQNQPVLAKGIGDEFTECLFTLKGFWLQIVAPRIHIPTAVAYGNITPEKPKTAIEEIIKMPINKWKGKLFNNFEAPIFKEHPELKDIVTRFYQEGALFSAMTGSGSAIYGIFEKEPNIQWNSNYTVHTENIH